MESKKEEDDVVSLDSPAKRPTAKLVFDQLPDEIIQEILRAADPDTFASLVLLNSNWRRAAQQAHLYAHQLAACPSYAASHRDVPDPIDQDLPTLRKAFAREVKRNLFEAYLRPAETIIKLVSNSISSSSCPGGDGLLFSSSPRGHYVLAYNSSRLHVLDVQSDNVEVEREFKISRRPVSTCITDHGSPLAVLSSEMQVDIYDLTRSPPRNIQSMILDHAPRAIALSPCGSVLAAAYESGIEVSSLVPGATTEKRFVKCDGVDSLAFSFDGTQLLGTTAHSASPNTVILTAPYYEPGNVAVDNLSDLWTTSLLFPNTSRDCSHAVLLQDTRQEEAAWTFTYDRSFETFRAVRIDDLRNGTTYFTGPIANPGEHSKLLPCTLPSATYRGDLVSAGFQGKDVWLYGIPEDLEAVPEGGPSAASEGFSGLGLGLGRRSSMPPSRTSSSRAHDSGTTRPQWQLLSDKLRNTFVWGVKVAELNGVSNVKWVTDFGDSSSKERLVIAASGLLPSSLIAGQDDIDFVDGGRITLFDFDYGITDGIKREITIDVGFKDPEVLEEEKRDIDTEVAIVRRRTVAQRRADHGSLPRSATTAVRHSHIPPLPSMSSVPAVPAVPDSVSDGNDAQDPLVPRRMGAAPPIRSDDEPAIASPEDGDGAEVIAAQEAVEAPYSHDNPRTNISLHRAATAVAANRRRQPEPAAGTSRYESTRADGRREHPHESDADNWVPPPPPYTKDDLQDLPAFLRHPATRPAAAAGGSQTSRPLSIGLSSETLTVWPLPHANQTPMHARGYQEPPGGLQNGGFGDSRGRNASNHPVSGPLRVEDAPRPRTSPSVHGGTDDSDLYDASPPTSPRMVASPVNNTQDVAQNQVHDPEAPGRVNLAGQGAPHTPYPSQDPSQPNKPGNPPTLDLQIPSANFSPLPDLNASVPPPPGQSLPNARTWPLAPVVQSHVTSSHPLTAPASTASANEMIAAALPYHASGHDQRVGYQGRDLQPSAGRFPLQHAPIPNPARSDSQVPGRQGHQQHRHAQPPNSSLLHEEQPLIISIPSGVTGAFDPPAGSPTKHPSETTILAPVPLHVSPNQTNSAVPTVDRLDPSYEPPVAAEPSTSSRNILPRWLSGPSSSSIGRGSHGSIHRKPSRAERSAARNMQDAKRKGWRGLARSKRKKNKPVEQPVASSATWTEDSGFSRAGEQMNKEKRCILM